MMNLGVMCSAQVCTTALFFFFNGSTTFYIMSSIYSEGG